MDEVARPQATHVLVGEPHEHRRVAHGVGVARADGAVGIAHLLERREGLQHLLETSARLGERRPRRALELDQELALVHRRLELGLQQREHAEAAQERGQGDGRHGLPVVECPADRALVRVGHPLEPVVEVVERALQRVAPSLPIDVGIVPARRQHRIECERHEQRHHYGERHREAELEEEPADDALHERHGHEDRDDRHRRRDHREADLGRALARGREVILPVLEVPYDVLAHHDRIVDQQADRQGQCHQRQHVQRHPQEVHDDERRDDRDGQRQARDDRRAPRVEEAEDDQDGQQPAEDERVLHVGDRLPDERRRVAYHLDLGPWRQRRPELVDRGTHRVDHTDGVGLRLLRDVDGDGGFPLDHREGALFLDRIVDRGDIRQADGLRAAAADYHPGVVGRILRLARDAQRHLGRSERQAPERRVDVLGGQPPDDLVDAHPECGHAGGVEVDEHFAGR